MRRLLTYLKPHKWTMTFATILVLFIIVVELYRPVIIGDAIDNYINGYYHPFQVTVQGAEGAVPYKDLWLVNRQASQSAAAQDSAVYYQLFLYEDRYYMAEGLTAAESEALTEGSPQLIQTYVDQGAPCMSKEQLKALRRYDFTGILSAAGLYLLMMALGFVLNAADTWMLQKMGQNIIFRMREQVFTHIHSLSLSFFNTTPVGKLVTRVSNDTEAVNEMFTTILVRLFKNVVKILGYAAVMLSISVRMTLVSFVLLPVVGALTFVFRFYSRKAYKITRNKITELNTFLSEHISGMRLIQVFVREKEKYQEFETKSRELFRANWREVMTFAIFRPSIYFLSIIAMVIVIGTGSYSVLGGTLSLGTLFIFITYISSFFEPIQELAEQFGTLQSSLASAEKVFSILRNRRL